MEMTLSLIYLLCATTRLRFKDHFYLMFDPYRVGPYRQNYWYSRKGQVLRKKLYAHPPGPKSLNDIHRSAHLTNSLGLTKPNPDYLPYAILQTVPPPDPDPPDPDPPDPPTPPPSPPPSTIYEITALSLRHSESKELCFIYNFVPGSFDKVIPYVPEHAESDAIFEIESEPEFSCFHLGIIISDDYDFATGQGEFAVTVNQPVGFSDNLPDPLPTDFPFLYHRKFNAPFNYGYMLLVHDIMPSSNHPILHVGERYELSFHARDSLGDIQSIGISSICQQVSSTTFNSDGQQTSYYLTNYNVFSLSISTLNPTQAGKDITFPESVIVQ